MTYLFVQFLYISLVLEIASNLSLIGLKFTFGAVADPDPSRTSSHVLVLLVYKTYRYNL